MQYFVIYPFLITVASVYLLSLLYLHHAICCVCTWCEFALCFTFSHLVEQVTHVLKYRRLDTWV